MSNSTGLYDYSDDALINELSRREATRAAGLCDYCRKSASEPTCAQAYRHQLAKLDPKRSKREQINYK